MMQGVTQSCRQTLGMPKLENVSISVCLETFIFSYSGSWKNAVYTQQQCSINI